MKECPKCGAQNKSDSQVCFNCFAPLDDSAAADTASQAKSTGSVAMPQTRPSPTPAPPVGAPHPTPHSPTPSPLNSEDEPIEQQTTVGQPYGGQSYQPPSPYGAGTPGSYGNSSTAPRRGDFSRPAPLQQRGIGGTIAIVIIVLILLGGGGYASWHFVLEPRAAVNTVRGFLAAASANDPEAAISYLSESSRALPGVGRGEGLSDFVASAGQAPVEGKDYTLKIDSIEGDRATVIIHSLMEENEAPAKPEELVDLPIVLVKEKSGWKIDLEKTMVELIKLMQQHTNMR